MASLGEDLLGIVNKLQDLVFNTIGNDSLDLPQIVQPPSLAIIFETNTPPFRSLLVPSPPANLLFSKILSDEISYLEAAVLLLEDP